jgi:hypothetical protein
MLGSTSLNVTGSPSQVAAGDREGVSGRATEKAYPGRRPRRRIRAGDREGVSGQATEKAYPGRLVRAVASPPCVT